MIGEAHEVRGVVLSAAGRSDEARTAFEAATSNYERKGIVPFMARIRERLASLEPQATGRPSSDLLPLAARATVSRYHATSSSLPAVTAGADKGTQQGPEAEGRRDRTWQLEP